MFVAKGTESTSPTYPVREAFVTTTRVVTWDPDGGTQSDLDTFLRERRRDGWRIQKCIPRILDGPRYGALVVMQKLTPSRTRIVRKEAVTVPEPRSPAEPKVKRRKEAVPVS